MIVDKLTRRCSHSAAVVVAGNSATYGGSPSPRYGAATAGGYNKNPSK
jgi:hypothetical protein